ncbi:threonine/serine exporter family protein [Herbiconiux moechotypicola]|uniref:Threonine/serine exporter family protein n=1 Tax=Herbiconiux moechotypicola TaxID=637393 RepID=A0ABP5QFI9_9MICO|nr:threonine/serine exporter family protein [Herbiconiux moechotypicola]MCS5730007.1 threonine/serine exporter family protein [Herbiconiux moechotypicola]
MRGEGGPAGDGGAADELIVAAVTALHLNGAGADRTALRVGRLAAALGREVRLDLGWGRSIVGVRSSAGGDGGGGDGGGVGRWAEFVVRGVPAAIGMNRVHAVDRAVAGVVRGTLDLAAARAALRAAAALPPVRLWLFVLACAVGATSLAVIFGADDPLELALVALAAGAGALLRRGVGRLGGSVFAQVALAALVAGLVGAVSLGLGLHSALVLAAVCPCMVLVPGPQLLNGSFDLAALRIPLGLARLAFAGVVLFSVGAGLVVGLALGGASLPVDPPAEAAPLWLDALCAGLAAVCYGVFYSAPLRILYWPFVVGAGVHALHWIAVELGHVPPALSAGVACLVAASVLLPVAERFDLPFSAIGFASVVALMPGVLVFRALSALTQLPSAAPAEAPLLLVGAVDDATQAVLTVFAMALGFVVANAAFRRLHRVP